MTSRKILALLLVIAVASNYMIGDADCLRIRLNSAGLIQDKKFTTKEGVKILGREEKPDGELVDVEVDTNPDVKYPIHGPRLP